MSITDARIDKMAIPALAMAAMGELIAMSQSSSGMELRTVLAYSLLVLLLDYAYIITCCIKRRLCCTTFFFLVLLSIPFYYGQHILAVFNPDYLLQAQTYSVLDGRIDDKSIIRATYLMIDCLLALFSGYICFVRNGSFRKDANNSVQLDRKTRALKISSWSFLLISAYPTYKYLTALYRLQQSYSYLARRMLESQSDYYQILGVSLRDIYISGLFLPAILGLFIAYEGKRYKGLLYGLVAGYCILYLLTGTRYTILKTLVSFFFIRYIWVKPITRSDIVKLLIIALVLLFSFEVAAVLRGVIDNGFTLSNAISAFDISGLLWESGITFTTVSNMLECCPSIVDFAYGKSLIGAFLQCLPGFLRFGFFEANTLHVSSLFSPLYYGTNTFGYGSSFIAEGYFNFGFCIFIYMFLLGMLVCKVDSNLDVSRAKKSPYLFLVMTILAGELVFGVRNDLSSIPRILLFGPCPIILVSQLIESVARRGGTDSLKWNNRAVGRMDYRAKI